MYMLYISYVLLFIVLLLVSTLENGPYIINILCPYFPVL